MTDTWTNAAHTPAYEMQLGLERRLDALRDVGRAGAVGARRTAALHAVHSAAAILQPAAPPWRCRRFSTIPSGCFP